MPFLTWMLLTSEWGPHSSNIRCPRRRTNPDRAQSQPTYHRPFSCVSNRYLCFGEKAARRGFSFLLKSYSTKYMQSPPKISIVIVNAQTSISNGSNILKKLSRHVSLERWAKSPLNYQQYDPDLWTGKERGIPSSLMLSGSGIVTIVNWSTSIAVVKVAMLRRSWVSQKSPMQISWKTRMGSAASALHRCSVCEQSSITHSVAELNFPNASRKGWQASKKNSSL